MQHHLAKSAARLPSPGNTRSPSSEEQVQGGHGAAHGKRLGCTQPMVSQAVENRLVWACKKGLFSQFSHSKKIIDNNDININEIIMIDNNDNYHLRLDYNLIYNTTKN